MYKRQVKVQLVDGQVASGLRPVPVPYQKMVLVCTHMSRDKRCGRAGPQVCVCAADKLKGFMFYVLGPVAAATISIVLLILVNVY